MDNAAVNSSSRSLAWKLVAEPFSHGAPGATKSVPMAAACRSHRMACAMISNPLRSHPFVHPRHWLAERHGIRDVAGGTFSSAAASAGIIQLGEALKKRVGNDRGPAG